MGVQEKPFITVSIHIRLTDFGQHLQRFWNVSLATQDYFTSAMEYFEDRYENVLFYVISDDMKSAKEYIHTEQNKKFNIAWPYNGAVKEGSNTWPQTDLALLSLSNHSIITFGTFGLWGSLLANRLETGEAILSKTLLQSSEVSKLEMALKKYNS